MSRHEKQVHAIMSQVKNLEDLKEFGLVWK